ncbi:MAG: hypothetical protein ACI4P4_00610 [Faecousia sp.]
MGTITIQNHHDCYDFGKEIFLGNLTRKEAVNALVESGMTERSAVYYLQCVCSMLSGKRYTATVNELATSYFLTQIFSDFEMPGLKTALQSMRAHLDYQKGKNELPGLEKLYQEFFDVLK